jgi:hypothetical protein
MLILFQVAWHWFLMWHNDVSAAALQFYLAHNDHSRKGVAGYLDIMLPAIIIGLLIGRIGWEWSLSKRAGFVVVAGIILVALRVIYMRIITEQQAWWWPSEPGGLTRFFTGQIIMTLFLLSLCVYGGRLWRIDGAK